MLIFDTMNTTVWQTKFNFCGLLKPVENIVIEDRRNYASDTNKKSVKINKYFIHEENELLGNMILKTSMLSKKSPAKRKW